MNRLWIHTLVVCLPALAIAQTRTLTLKEALDQAAKLSPETQSARLKSLEADAAAQAARNEYNPQLTARVQGTYQTNNLQGIGLVFPGFPSRLGPFRTFDARPVLTQTVIDLSLISGIRAARERKRETEFDAETIRETTLLAVTQLYLQALQAESRIAASGARKETAAAVLQQARDFEAAGTASKLDVARAEQQYFQEDVAVTQARRDRATLGTLLLRTIGLEAEGEVTIESPPLRAELDLMEGPEATGKALAARSELKAIDSRIRSAELTRDQERRAWWPKLGFQGDYGVLGAGPEQSLSTYNVGATLTFPLWTGGRVANAVKVSEIRRDQGRVDRRRAELAVRQEVAEARIELDAARRALVSAGEATAAARRSLELSRLRFASGIATNLDTVTAQGTLAQAEDLEIRTRYDLQLARARLARALGDVRGFAE